MLAREVILNIKNRAILYGMLLGDGCLKTKLHTKKDESQSTYYEYVLCHSVNQFEYLEYKRNLFHSIMGGKLPKIHFENVRLGDKIHQSCRFSRCNKYFRIIHKRLYSLNNKKYFTRKILDYLTPEAIAIWYMDDGGLKKSKRSDGSISSCQMFLFTYFSEEEADTTLNYFSDVWGIQGKKYLYFKNNSWYLGFNTTEGRKFESLIKDYIIPSMKYKLPNSYNPRVLDTLIGDDIV